jgi:IS5 family transposase
MKLIDFIITVFTIVDNFCQRYFPVCKLRKRGFKPKLADSEVITMEVVGEFKGFHEDKGIYQYFKQHWLHLFPNMPDRSNFVRQAASLWKVKERFFEYLQTQKEQWLQIVDSMPIEVCKFVRAKYTKLFKGLASYGKWFGETFFGYKLHLKISRIGMIRSFIVTPANIHDIRCVEELVGKDNPSWILGDKGYRSESLRKKLWEERGIYIHTSLRRNDAKTSPLPKSTIRKLTGIRRLVETVAGQLEQQFSIKKTFARNPWHLFNRIVRKIVSHTFGVFLNLKLNRDPLKLKSLIC